MMKRQKNQITRRTFLKKGLVAAAGLVVGAKAVQALADYEHQKGKFEITNYVSYGKISLLTHNTLHWPGGEEGYDENHDYEYKGPFNWDLAPITTKIISKVEGHELRLDRRPVYSMTPVDLELSLHSQSGADIVVNNLKNELRCSFVTSSLTGEIYDFGKKPISLWRRHFGELDEPVGLELLAHLRKAIAKSPGEIAIIPLPNLNEVYCSEVPYDFLQLRFDVFPGDLNLDGKGDEKDYAILGNDWKNRNSKTGGLVSDIDGPNGVPDGELDFIDANDIFEDRFKNINDPNTW